MIDDHSKANDELKALAAQKGEVLPTELDASHKALQDRLSKLSGDAFDKAYMAARPTWKGFLKISLVNIPVRVFPATDSAATISFNQLHAECQTRIQQKRWCPHCEREVPMRLATSDRRATVAPGPCIQDEPGQCRFRGVLKISQPRSRAVHHTV